MAGPRGDPLLRGDRAPGRAVRRARRHRRAPDRRRAARPPRLPAPRLDAAQDRRHRGPLGDHQRLPARARRCRPRRRRHRPRQRLDRLPRPRPLPRDHPPRRAAAGAARPRGDRGISSGCGRSRSTRSRCATSPSRRSSRFCELARSSRLPGPLHRVHAARRRPRMGPRAGPDRSRDPGADRGAPPARRAAARAPRDRSGLPLRRRARARSASSTRSPSPSAAIATGSG